MFTSDCTVHYVHVSLSTYRVCQQTKIESCSIVSTSIEKESQRITIQQKLYSYTLTALQWDNFFGDFKKQNNM